AEYRQALAAYRAGAVAEGTAGNLAQHWSSNAFAGFYLPQLERIDPGCLDAAAAILATRAKDVRLILETPGYLRTERFGGDFEVDGT
ncbi:MAG TPA: hypothetical protein VFG14_17305, partial [Chthoniobacteraceae bacterium]|nr:hypothetical protein [Chthoniobacteraceae bacterium]